MERKAQYHQAYWWQQGVIYQIYPRSFKDSTGDGIGDLAGIIAELDYLTWLGVDAIWISPIYPSPMVDFGYDVTDFTGIDPIFGDLATFDTLIVQAHQRNLKVIMDYVPNHTSDRHPWFLESRSSRHNPKRDWYVWAEPMPDGSPPNNWLGSWGGSAWEWDDTTRQYYLHSYHKTMPDLNWRNPAVKNAMLDVVRFWLDRGVDGIRIDSAHRFMKDPQLRDNPPNPNPKVTAYKLLGDYDAQLHLYDKGHADIHTVYRELRTLLDAYSPQAPRVALGEMHIFDWQEWASYYGARLDELHMPLNFGLIGVPWKARSVRQLVDAVEAALLPEAWPNYVLGNHDEPRVATRLGSRQARVGMMLLLTLRGTPTLYYGDEIGMHNVAILPQYVHDPWEKNLPAMGFGRDPERSPMQWDDGPNAGFCPPAAEPWLPIPDDYTQVNVATQRKDQHSMLSLTLALLKLRRATQALTLGSYAPIEGVPEECFLYVRQLGRQRRLIALNFSSSGQQIQLSEMGSGRVLVSTHLDREEPVDLASFYLRADEGCVIEQQDTL
ncbi:MAG TPA: alpha-amylase family glycosyl hydrolase [Ktedonobacteraceae bacterium]